MDRFRVGMIGFGVGKVHAAALRGVGFAMGNAPLLVRVETDLTVGSNDQDGVAQAIDTILSQK